MPYAADSYSKSQAFGKNSNVVMKNREMFFCGIWDYWAANHDMAVILQILGLWPLKKIQNFFFHFYEFFLKIWYKKGQKSCIFNEKLKNVFFFLRSIPFWGFFLRWCTLERSKMVQNSWKLIFPDFSDNSREKQIFVNFLSFLAILRCITFMVDSNLGQNEGILKAF